MIVRVVVRWDSPLVGEQRDSVRDPSVLLGLECDNLSSTGISQGAVAHMQRHQ
jgi:hypothetical protein